MGKSTGLAQPQLCALDRLKEVPGLEAFYLAGGTAIAIHLDHRRSLDLDLFSLRRDINLDEIATAASAALSDFRVLGQSDATLRAVLGGVVVDFVRYSYPPLAPPPAAFPSRGSRTLRS